MSGQDWFGAVGSGFSIVSACWAWYQAIQAGKWANKAEQIFMRKRITSDLRALVEQGSGVFATLKPYSYPSTARGRGLSALHNTVQEYLHALRMHRTSLRFLTALEVSLLEMDSLLADLSAATTPDSRAEAARKLLISADAVTSAIKEQMVSEMERVEIS